MDFSKLDWGEHMNLAREVVKRSVGRDFPSREKWQKFRNQIIKERGGSIFPNLHLIKAYEDLLAIGAVQADPAFFALIQKRRVRTLSGVSPVTVLTKAYPCPGRCVYCPTDVRMPKSYLPSQPAAQRGFRQRFNPYTQVFVRLKALKMTGHPVSKIELRVLGGTWSSYPRGYQTWFLKRCLQALNEFPEQIKRQNDRVEKRKLINPYGGEDEVNVLRLRSLSGPRLTWKEAVSANEIGVIKCIGINIETRPDHIDEKEIARLRNLGVTKVEMGVQTTNEAVQRLTKRGHDLACVKRATALLKDAGFKIGYHMMPNLPGADPDQDEKMIADLFADSDYCPDYLKIYPCVVVPKSELALIYRRGGYRPYSDAVLEKVLLTNLKDVPEWCRLDRVARDIPADEIEAGFKLSNIRQVLERKLVAMGSPCRDIRAREIQNSLFDPVNVGLEIRRYAASGGEEIFLSYEDKKQDKLIALLRLRFPSRVFLSELTGAALVREVHVYGQQLSVGEKGFNKQHAGWGGRLLQEAEKLAQENGYERIAVIAGIGTRQYYAKHGYALRGSYMLKDWKR